MAFEKKKTSQDIYAEIVKTIKAKEIKPIYFLQGEEVFFIDKITDLLEQSILEESEKDFNQSILYGSEIKAGELLSVLNRFPLMAEKQVVILKEAQKCTDLEKLESYFKSPLDSTVFIVNYKGKKLDGRKAFAQTMNKSGFLFTFDHLQEYQLVPWIESYVNKEGFKIDLNSSQMLSDYLGNDLSKIANELDKLSINVAKGSTITPAIIEKFIGISKEFNVLELNNSLGKKDVLKANQIINYFKQNPKAYPLVLTIGMLFNYFSKLLIIHHLQRKGSERTEIAKAISLPEFVLREYEAAARNYPYPKTIQVISFLREYDLKSKGVNSAGIDDSELLKELIFKILH